MEYNRHRRNSKAYDFYLSPEWRKKRATILKRFSGLDIYAYYIQHKIAAADMVHHIIEIDEDWTLRFNDENLIPLSNTNHGIISALYRRDEATKKATQKKLKEIMQKFFSEGRGA